MNQRKPMALFATTAIALLLTVFVVASIVLPASAAASPPPASGNVSLIKHLGGESRAVDVAGSFAYIGVGPRLTIVNIANPLLPSLRSQTAPLSDVIESLVYASPYVYLVNGDGGLHIYNVSDVNNPVEVGYADTPGSAVDVAFTIQSGVPYVFVADGDNGVLAYNVADAGNPTLVPAASYSGSNWINGTQVTLLDGLTQVSGTAEGVAVLTQGISETFVYVASGYAGLVVWDAFPLIPPAAEVTQFVRTPAETANDPYYVDVIAKTVVEGTDRLYVADSVTGLRIFNFAEGAGTLTHLNTAYDPALSGSAAAVAQGADLTTVFIATGLSGYDKIDVTIPAAPVVLNTVDTPGNAVALQLLNNYAYVADSEHGLRVVDHTTATETGAYAGVGFPQDVAFLGDYAYIADGTAGLKTLNISTPANATLSSTYEPPSGLYSFDAIAVSGTAAYVGDSLYGLRVFNLTVSATPTLAGDFAAAWAASDVAVMGNRAYVAAGADGLRVLNVTNPAAISELGSFNATLGAAQGVFMVGNTAYVANLFDGLHILNTTNPAAISELGSFVLTEAYDVVVVGTTAYVAAGSQGLQVLNVSNPASVTLIGSLTTSSATSVAVVGKYVLIADYSAGVRVIDVSTPATPVEVGYYDTSGTAVAVNHNRYAYVADQEGGAWILDALSTDLNITKTDGKTTVLQNATNTYTITISNNGSHHADGAVVSDTFPAGLQNVTWTCSASAGSTCPAANGSGNLNATINVLAGGQVTFLASGTVGGVGALVNTATVAWATAVDTNSANDSATDTTATAVTDLSIAKTDGTSTAIPGTTHVYTITASNLGPSAVTGATVTDTVPSALNDATWTCAASSGSSCPASGAGNINASVDLLVNGTATFVIVGTLDPAATGTLINSAGITAPTSVADTNLANNFAQDTTTLTPQADFGLIKSETGAHIAGTIVTYTLVASNSGPGVAAGTVTDNFDAKLTNVAWTCNSGNLGSSCPASGTGNINATVTLLLNRPVTFTVVATIDPVASGAVNNTASITTTGGVADPTPANNSASANFTIGTPTADLSITKTDGQSVADAGDPVTYTLVVANLGPSAVSNAIVTDTFGASLENMTWTCAASIGSSCPIGSGTGNINTVVNLAVNGVVTFTAPGNITLAAIGNVSNTAYVSAPAGTTDPNTANNSATDTTALSQTDLSITKTDSKVSAVPGTSNTYVIVVTNAGPTAVSGATVTDTLPAVISGATWTCAASAGSTCPASGNGNLNASVDLSVGGSATFTLTGTINPAATGSLINQASVASSASVADINLINNFATDTDTLTPQFDLSLSKTDGQASVVPGTLVTYTLVVAHSGSSTAVGTLTDTFPTALTGATWTCAASAGSSCPASGTGNLSAPITVAPSGLLTVTASATINPAATGSLANTATVAASGDTNSANNSATDTDTLTPQADLSISKTSAPDPVTAGEQLTYTLIAANAGPSTATSVVITDALPAGLTYLNAAPSTGTCTMGAELQCTTSALAPGSSMSVLVTVLVNSDTTAGSITNAAGVHSAVTDPATANNFVITATTIEVWGDLHIAKSHSGTLVPGTAITYTITVSNSGPSKIVGAVVTDTFPASVTGVTWTCAASAGSTCAANGSDHISTTVDLSAGGNAVFTAAGTLSLSATGSVVNTAYVFSMDDPNPADNTATDTVVLATADLGISKTDGQVTAIPGRTITYTLVVTNAGPSPVTGATVADTFPASLSGVTWTCSHSAGSACPASGSGNLNASVDVLVGGNVTFVAVGTIDAAATGSLSNSATVSSIIDNTPGNNTATDVDTLTPQADLSIAKTHAGSLTPGTLITYTITAVNAGPSVVSGAIVTDNFPAAVTNVTWTCTGCAVANGNGNLNTTANLNVGASVTIVAQGTLSAAASGSLVNTAYVASAIDPNAANNSATDTVTIGGPLADLRISQSHAGSGVPGTTVTYTLVVSNSGPSAVTGATVVDDFPANITGVTWTCTGGCVTANGNGNLNAAVNLGVNGSATFVAKGTINPAATGTVINWATITPPSGANDPDENNNTASDVLTLTPQLDASITGVAQSSPVNAGQVMTYVLTVANSGPSAVLNAQVLLPLPANATFVSATAGCGHNAGTVTCNVASIAAGGNAVLNVLVNVKPLNNTPTAFNAQATVFASGDSTPANNVTTVSATVNPYRLYLPIVRR